MNLSALSHDNQTLVIASALMLAAPLLISGNPFFAFVLGLTLIHILWTAGMNLLYGYVGLMPLMFAGIAGISAYGTVYLTMTAGWSFWAAMPLASLCAAGIGVVLGLPSLRLRGFYFTLCSLVIQTVLTLVFVSFPAWTNGDTGISQIPAPDLAFQAGRLAGTAFNVVLGAIAVAGVVAVAGIVAAPLGRQLIAVREDEVLAETIGINVVWAKVLAFFIGSLYAAIGGAFYATYIGFISPRSFDVLASLNIWLMVAFGGRGSILGPIIGTIILVPIPFILQDYYTLKDVVYGALIIVVIVLMPAGVFGEITKRLSKRGTVVACAASEEGRP